jgi:O-antigen/teichoic acid export membrane protein
MRWLGPTGVVAVMSYALTSVLITTSQFFFLRRLVGDGSAVPAACAGWRRQMWVYSWPFSLWGIFTWTQQAADRWALQTFSSMQDVGMYAVVYQLGFMPIGLVLGMVMNLLAPILFQRASSAQAHAGDSVHSITWRAAQLGLLATLGVFVLTLALHDLIFKLLVAAEYQKISYLLPWMSLAGGLFAAGQMLSLKLLSEMRPATMLAAKILTSILGVVASIAGAYYYGTHGVAFAMVAFSGTFFAWMALLARQPLCTIPPHREGDAQS